MCSPLTSPPSFPSILDAILHYYPVKSPPLARLNPVSPLPDHTHTRVRNVSSAHGSNFGYPYPSPRSRFLNPQPAINAPQPSFPISTQRHSQPHTSYKPKSPGGRERMAGLSKSFQDEPYGLSPNSAGRPSRLSPSPSRHHGLSALSPLQAFSPLSTPSLPNKSLAKDKRQTSPSSGTNSPRGHSRSASLTRSLSRRQSLIANAERWGRGDEDNSRGDVTALFSRITLVKAPTEETTLKRYARRLGLY